MEIECPMCETEFFSREWHEGECPNCGNKYIWDFINVAEDLWLFPVWDNHPLDLEVEDVS